MTQTKFWLNLDSLIKEGEWNAYAISHDTDLATLSAGVMDEAFEPDPASPLFPLSALAPSLNIMSQFLFLHDSPLVPLMVPHLGHLRTPRRVAFPNPERSDFALAEVEIDMSPTAKCSTG